MRRLRAAILAVAVLATITAARPANAPDSTTKCTYGASACIHIQGVGLFVEKIQAKAVSAGSCPSGTSTWYHLKRVGGVEYAAKYGKVSRFDCQVWGATWTFNTTFPDGTQFCVWSDYYGSGKQACGTVHS